MSTAKYTPGPWTVDDEVSEDEAGQETLGVYAEHGGYIAGIHCGPDTTIDDQDSANAHLIAAAPAMYEALLDMIDLAKVSIQFDEDDDVKALDRARIGKAEKALAQAEGRHS